MNRPDQIEFVRRLLPDGKFAARQAGFVPPWPCVLVGSTFQRCIAASSLASRQQVAPRRRLVTDTYNRYYVNARPEKDVGETANLWDASSVIVSRRGKCLGATARASATESESEPCAPSADMGVRSALPTTAAAPDGVRVNATRRAFAPTKVLLNIAALLQ